MKPAMWVSFILCAAFQVQILAADFSGVFKSPPVTLELKPTGNNGYAGTLSVKGVAYPAKAQEQNGDLIGSFNAGGTDYIFTAKLAGQALSLVSAGKTYELTREGSGAEGNPLEQPPANPLEGGGNAPANNTPPANAQPPQPSGTGSGPTGQAAIDALRNLKAPGNVQPADWVVLVYLDADCNLESAGVQDINEMEAGFPRQGVEVLVLMDRHKEYDRSCGDWSNARLYRVRKDVDPNVIASELVLELGEINLGDPNVLGAFIEGSLRAFPARNRALVMWNHGGGWAMMASDDDAPGAEGNYDHVTMPELKQSMMAGLKANNLSKFEIVGFDMCLMGQINVAAELSDVADVMVASQAIEPNAGWPWTQVMEAFGKGTIGGRRIGTEIVSAYGAYYREAAEDTATLSAIDLTLTGELVNKLNLLIEKIEPTMKDNWAALSRAIFYAEQYNMSRDEFRNGKSAFQSVDLLDVLKRFRQSVKNFPAENEYRDLISVSDRFVISAANSHKRRMSNGIAIYAPVIESCVDPEHATLAFSMNSKWPQLLSTMHKLSAENSKPPVFANMQVLDDEKKPAQALVPFYGYRLGLDVTGNNIVWIHDWLGIRDQRFAGVRVLAKTFIVDANYLQRIIDAEAVGQEVDLIMPTYVDGENKLQQIAYGAVVHLTDGQKSVEVMIDNSDVAHPDEFNIPCLFEHPDLGPKPLVGMLMMKLVTFAPYAGVAEVVQPDGSKVIQRIKPAPDLKITPIFTLVKDDNTREMVAADSILWGPGLYCTMETAPAGHYESVFYAETLGGVQGIGRFKYRIEPDQNMLNAKAQWQNAGVKSEDMIGTWDWNLLGEGGKDIPAGMTVVTRATQFPFLYDVVATGKDETTGKETRQTGKLFIELKGQPHYRLILDNEKGSPGVLIGPAWWLAKGTQARMLVRDLGLDTAFTWIKREELAQNNVNPQPLPNPNPNPIPNPSPNPVPPPQPNLNWPTFVDMGRKVSVPYPPNWVSNPQLLAQAQQVFPNAEFLATDMQTGAAVSVLRHANAANPQQIMQTYQFICQQIGIPLQFGQMAAGKLGTTDVQYVTSNSMNMNMGITNGVTYFVPLGQGQGYLTVELSTPQATAQQSIGSFQQIINNTKIAP